ncbi:PIN domain-containing protein [Micromonospora sp. CPCC 206061]|uniref:PIN domain-containing protein n=1 Tax=Micromonospora sp. CPCC 206061 TaxID=3122410 RepID=UPI002FEEAE45
MKLEGATGAAARPSTVDHRRRFTLPTALADAAGIAAGLVVVLRGERPGELVVATGDAALARVRSALAATLDTHGAHGSLSAALVDGLGRPAPGPATGAPVDLPADGLIICDTSPLLALLDGDPAGDALVPLLPRLVITEAVADELFAVLLAAGMTATGNIPAAGSGRQHGFDAVADVLAALGLRTAGLDTEWAPVRVLQYQLRRAGDLADAERATLALAAHLGAPALLGRPVGELPPAVSVTVLDHRDLAPAGDAPAAAAA